MLGSVWCIPENKWPAAQCLSPLNSDLGQSVEIVWVSIVTRGLVDLSG